MINDPSDIAKRFAGFDEPVSRASSSATKRWATRKGYDPSSPETYDIDHVYTRATNKHDHSAKITVHMPRDQQIFFARLVADDATPYETIADLCRDGLVHRAKHWEDKIADPGYVPDFNLLAMKARAEDFKQEYEAQKAIVEDASVMLTQLVSDRSWTSLAEQIFSYRAGVESLKEPWRERMDEILATAEARLPDDDDLIG